MAKFVPRQRKHKVLARERAQDNARHEVGDTNQEILPARTGQDHEQKRALLKASLQQDGVKVSGKKAKRLEKYIDNKLRKDESRELLAKLAERRIDTSLFSSSRSLGQGRETKKQALSRALREHRAGIDVTGENEEILFEKRRDVSEEGDSGEEEEEEEEEEEMTGVAAEPEAVIAAAPAKTESAIGSGLKRPLEVDEEGRPIIQKRRKRGGIETKTPAIPQPTSDESDDEEEEWNGFSGDDDSKARQDEDEDDSASEESDGNDPEGQDSEENTSEEDSDDSDSESSEEDSHDGEQKSRSSAFKAWANQQRNEALGFQPTEEGAPLLQIPKPENFVPRAPEQDPLPMELQVAENTSRKVFSVPVTRTPEIQAARMKLPVVAEEQRVMEAIHLHDIVFICGSTGSGKTTQIPQFLYEAGYGSPDSPTPGMIGITQPRRVAAVSMSKRVAEELGDIRDIGNHSAKVAYQIRFEGNVEDKTAIKFMTDGVLLREVAQDIALRKYSAIIIDEAHERSVNTDILIGMVSRVIKLRKELAAEDPAIKPLKLVIMSATLRVEELTSNPNLFASPPPTIDIEGRQHPVTMHFSRHTRHDYVEEAFRKISRGHKKLPPGGFLVFLTGRNEILELSKKLKAAFGGPRSVSVEGPKVQISANDAAVEVEDLEFGDRDDRSAEGYEYDEVDGIPSEDEAEEEEDEFKIEDGEEQEVVPLKMQVLPLYSLLPVREQMRVFEEPPAGTRQIILATNVAETSLTIPGIRFVFDSGRSKERIYDGRSGVQSYQIGWISKASAQQRSGRAGRTGPGHCYRLYSSAVYERDFAEFQDPEMLRMPVEGVVLQLKAMNLQHVVNFPFPTPPDPRSLLSAEKMLTYLSAISPSGQITKIGTTMSRFPLAPRFARILLVGHLHDCLPYTVALVAGLSAADVFLHENQAIPALAAAKEDDSASAVTSIRSAADVIAEDRQAAVRRTFNQVHKNFCFLDDKSDAIKLLQVVGEFAHDPTEAWCESHFVRFKVLREVQQLRRQVTDLLRANIASCAGLQYTERLEAPSPKQVSALKQMAAAGFIDQVAIRADLAPNPPEAFRKPRRAIDVPYVPLSPLHSVGSGGSGAGEDPCVYIHPTSPLAHLSPKECPEYIVYAYLQSATPSGSGSLASSGKRAKTRMHAITDVTGAQLAGLARGTPLLTYGKPIKEIKAQTVVDGVVVRECWVIPYLRAENTGGQGWPLPAQRVKQKKLAGQWVIE